VDAFEAAIADLEGAEAAEAFSSGMAAITSIFLSMCSPGDRIVAARQLYGGAYSFLAHMLPRFQIETTFVDVDDHQAFARAAPGAKLLYCETIGNPRIQVADIPALGAIANEHGVPLVVDTTFASPVICRPIEHGAAMVVHSATKFIGGHHDLIGGVVCSTPDRIAQIAEWTREVGPTLSPFNAWLALRGLSTIHLRVRRSSDTALKVARFLENHDGIAEVFYPALDSSPSKELCDRLLGGVGGGTMSFDVAGGRESASRFQDALRLIAPAASLGGSHSLIVHAASVTHTQLSADELAAAGFTEGLCRLSIGLEDPDDLIADLDRALATG
jgi:cystathionine beta-lyase/cystathionine gamma-synthase